MTNCHVLDRWWRSKHSRCTLWFSVWLLPLLDFESLMVMLIIPSFSCFFRSPSRGGLNLDIVHTYQQPQLLLWNSSTGKEINHFTEPMTCITGRVTRVFVQHTDCTFKKSRDQYSRNNRNGTCFSFTKNTTAQYYCGNEQVPSKYCSITKTLPSTGVSPRHELKIHRKKTTLGQKLKWPNVTVKTSKTHKMTSCFFNTFSVFD